MAGCDQVWNEMTERMGFYLGFNFGNVNHIEGATDFLSSEHTLHRVIWRASTQEQEAAELLGKTLRSAQHERVHTQGSLTQLSPALEGYTPNDSAGPRGLSLAVSCG
jgi:hypothetical protein